jgi:hypothetical protein
VLSTMPLRQLFRALSPPAPPEVVAAAERLKYRDFITVALILDQAQTFPDNWIYVHDPQVKLGRVQNFKNWSPDIVPDQRMSCLGLEHFCFEGDGLWTMADRDLIALRHARDGGDRADRSVEGRRRHGRADAEGLSGVRRRLRGVARGRSPQPGPIHQPAGRWAQRHAQVQQPGSLDGHGDAVGAEPARRAPRRVGRERTTNHEETELGEALPHDQLRALRANQPGVPRRV